MPEETKNINYFISYYWEGETSTLTPSSLPNTGIDNLVFPYSEINSTEELREFENNLPALLPIKNNMKIRIVKLISMCRLSDKIMPYFIYFRWWEKYSRLDTSGREIQTGVENIIIDYMAIKSLNDIVTLELVLPDLLSSKGTVKVGAVKIENINRCNEKNL